MHEQQIPTFCCSVAAARQCSQLEPSNSTACTPYSAWPPLSHAGAFASALPTSAFTGVAVPMLRAVGDLLDAVLVMSYDAGPQYDPRAAYQAYRSYFAGGCGGLGVKGRDFSAGHMECWHIECTCCRMYVASEKPMRYPGPCVSY